MKLKPDLAMTEDAPMYLAALIVGFNLALGVVKLYEFWYGCQNNSITML